MWTNTSGSLSSDSEKGGRIDLGEQKARKPYMLHDAQFGSCACPAQAVILDADHLIYIPHDGRSLNGFEMGAFLLLAQVITVCFCSESSRELGARSSMSRAAAAAPYRGERAIPTLSPTRGSSSFVCLASLPESCDWYKHRQVDVMKKNQTNALMS